MTDDLLPHDDDLKWFGEGFDGFPKRLPDDCVEYALYAVDDKLAEGDITATRTRLNQILQTARKLIERYTKDYIWQRDPFELKLFPHHASARRDGGRIPHLRGRTHFGDSLADEWLVVYLLVELSNQCPDAWIRVYDTDGEFLLIEAAGALPKWLNPDIAEHRVWIHRGHLRFIPLLDDNRATAGGNLGLGDAVAFLRHESERLIFLPFVEEEAFWRLRVYPAAIETTFHHAVVEVPRRLAFVLRRDPRYISPATEAFYLRDPISLRPLATKDLSTLHFPPEDFVRVGVKFTRVGFAQLRGQVFDAPPAWTGVIPRLRDIKVEMGMKVTCGFEMMLSDRQNEDKRAVREIKLLLEDVESKETLPTDEEILNWPHTQDDEGWLDIDYTDFENELAGGKGEKAKGAGFGDQGAQENLRKLVSRFEDFLNDDKAGVEGVDDLDDDDSDDSDDDGSDGESGEDKNASFDEAEFEHAMKEMMGMPADQIEKSGLLDEARRLALEDEKSGEAPDEEEDIKKVMEMMEMELQKHGALNLNNERKSKMRTSRTEKPVFGPERPPGKDQGALAKGKANAVDETEDIGPGEEELSSEDEDFNDVDLGLVKNMLEAFKGQTGMAGPAGNLMRALGVNMPRDEAEREG